MMRTKAASGSQSATEPMIVVAEVEEKNPKRIARPDVTSSCEGEERYFSALETRLFGRPLIRNANPVVSDAKVFASGLSFGSRSTGIASRRRSRSRGSFPIRRRAASGISSLGSSLSEVPLERDARGIHGDAGLTRRDRVMLQLAHERKKEWRTGVDTLNAVGAMKTRMGSEDDCVGAISSSQTNKI